MKNVIFRGPSRPFAALIFLMLTCSLKSQCPFSFLVDANCSALISFTTTTNPIHTVIWNFGDGSEVRGLAGSLLPTSQAWHTTGTYGTTVTHRFLCSGTPTVKLTVLDKFGNVIALCSQPVSVTVPASGPANCANNNCNMNEANFDFNPMDFLCSRLVLRATATSSNAVGHEWRAFVNGAQLPGYPVSGLSNVALPIRNINTHDNPIVVVRHRATMQNGDVFTLDRYATLPLNSIFIGTGETCGQTSYFTTEIFEQLFHSAITYDGLPCRDIYVTGSLIFDNDNPFNNTAELFFNGTNFWMGPSARLVIRTNSGTAIRTQLHINDGSIIGVQGDCPCIWNGIEVENKGEIALNYGPGEGLQVVVSDAFNAVRLTNPNGTGLPVVRSENALFFHNFIGIRLTDGITPNFAPVVNNVFDGGDGTKPLLRVCHELPGCAFEYELNAEFPFTVDDLPIWYQGNELNPHRQGFAGILVRRDNGSLVYKLKQANSFRRLADGIILRNCSGDISNCSFEEIDVFDYTTPDGTQDLNSGNGIHFVDDFANHYLIQTGLGSGENDPESFLNVRRAISIQENANGNNTSITANNMENVQLGVNLVIGNQGNFNEILVEDNRIVCEPFANTSVAMPLTIPQVGEFSAIELTDGSEVAGTVSISLNNITVNPEVPVNLPIEVHGINYTGNTGENPLAGTQRRIINNDVLVNFGGTVSYTQAAVGIRALAFNGSQVLANLVDYQVELSQNFDHHGIRVISCTNNSAIFCNRVFNELPNAATNLATGIGIEGCANPDIHTNHLVGLYPDLGIRMNNGMANVRQNKFWPHQTNPFFTTGIGIWHDNAIIMNQINKGNRWNDAELFGFGARRDGGSLTNYRVANLPECVPFNWLPFDFIQDISTFCPFEQTCHNYEVEGPNDESIQDIDEPTANGTDGITRVGLRWAAKRDLYQRLVHFPGLITGNSTLTTFKQDAASGPLGQLWAVGQAISALADFTVSEQATIDGHKANITLLTTQLNQTEADLNQNPGSQNLLNQWQTGNADLFTANTALNNYFTQIRQNRIAAASSIWQNNEAVVTTGVPDFNEKRLFKMYLETELTGSRAFIAADLTILDSLTRQCPEDAGPAVYHALAWFKHRTGETRNPIKCAWLPVLVNERFEEEQKLAISASENGFQLQPNPASGNCQLVFGKQIQSGQIRVTDSFGRLVFQTALAEKTDILFLNSHSWPSGCYSVNLIDHSGQPHLQRLLIQH